MLFQEEYLKLTLSLSLERKPNFIYEPGEHTLTLSEGQNNFLYLVKPRKDNLIPVRVLEVNNKETNVDLIYDINTSKISKDSSDINEETLFVKSSTTSSKPYNREVRVQHSDGQEIKWNLVLNEGKKSHLVKRTKTKKGVILEKRTVDTSDYCYVMECPQCGELRYCKPASIKLVKLCNACALDRTREKKASYVRRKRKIKDER